MAASTPRKTTTTRKAPAKRAPKATTTPPAELGIVLDDAGSKAAVAAMLDDREPLFTIGEVTYTIPKHVPPSWTLKAYTLAVTEGESAAMVFAAQKLLTDEAWTALGDCDTLTQDGLNAVLKALMDRILPAGVIGPKA
ncbi:hypothetical protein AB0383_48705 [Amycolatopsis sp. NPDC051373]|uniref:hypothetical protein n=1 Tax=Amycolatopsis sp. NPDC051373 TaxID=3155801 RepID=UPI00344EA962